MRTFFDAVRENTGRHMLDSGDHYGRHHEQPPVAVDAPAVTWDKWEDCSATIETAHFLTEAFEMRDDLNTQFDEWEDEREGSWFDLGPEFMRERGYVRHARGNVCNGENDLSQVYVYEVWGPEDGDDKGGDWYYIDDAVAVIYVHTGCDIRGGYTRPYFAEPKGDYAVPFDLSAEYYIEGSNTLSDDAAREIDQEWTCGYSGYPFGAVRDRVKRWFPWTFTETSRVALLDTGDVVRIHAAIPYLGG
jgi:hypothetical protein